MEIVGHTSHDFDRPVYGLDHNPSHQQHVMVDQAKLKKLRLRIDTDDPLHHGMKKLKISGKDLGHLPAEIFQIDELEVLDLSPERQSCLYYRLTHVPIGVGKLINLRILMLDTNELTELPQEICLLSALERLSLSNNHLKTLPDAFSSLRNLKSLHIANNKLEKMPFPICDLANLQFLDASDNMLKELPAEISSLKNLESLLLIFNRLSELPDSICEMKELRVLWLGKNNLRRLPTNFGQLRHLDWGYRHTSSSVIDGNPMQHPPLEVCKKGVEAISKYFAAAEPNGRPTDRSNAPNRGQLTDSSRAPDSHQREYSPRRDRSPSPQRRSPDHRWERDRSRDQNKVDNYQRNVDRRSPDGNRRW